MRTTADAVAGRSRRTGFLTTWKILAQPSCGLASRCSSSPMRATPAARSPPGGPRSSLSALRGAIQHVKTRATALSLPAAVSVLVVGGPKDACDATSVDELVNLARDAAREEPIVRTAIIVL